MIVENVADLADIDVNTEAIRIAHRVGARKRAEIIAKATEMNLKVLNLPVSEEAGVEEEGEEAAEGAEAKTEEKKKTGKEDKKKPKKEETSKKKESKSKKKENKKQ